MAEQIKLMADYGCWPVWYSGSDPKKIGPIDPKTLPLSRVLKDRLLKWPEVFDKQLNMQDPHDVFNAPEWTPADELWFDREGTELWVQLRAELGSEYQVTYFFRGKIFDDPASLPACEASRESTWLQKDGKYPASNGSEVR